MTIGVLPADQSTDSTVQHDYRQQLSALMDGELAADQARFLLRRISHDEALAACQERWQMIGDVLRGQASAPAPVGFRAQVQRALAVELAADQKTYIRGKPWRVGVALAASIAAVSVLLVVRTSFLTVPPSLETAQAPSAIMPMSTEIHSPRSALTLSAQAPAISVMPADPFALAPEPAAKPWPRSTLPTTSDAFNARAPSQSEPFYPFTPPHPAAASFP